MEAEIVSLRERLLHLQQQQEDKKRNGFGGDLLVLAISIAGRSREI